MTNLIEEFKEKKTALDGLYDKYLPERRAIQSEFEAAVKKEWVKVYPKKKFSMNAATTDLPIFEEVRKPFQEKAGIFFKKSGEERTALQKRLQELADTIVIMDDLKIDDKALWAKYSANSTSDFSTQCDSSKYTRAAADMNCEHVKYCGIQAEVRQEPIKTQFSDLEYYNVYAGCSSEVCEIIRMKDGPPLRTIVKRLWSTGTNPRVLMPFLPHGYEDSVGLDYFGKEKK